MITADRKLRVGVIFGGRSGEHAVSLESARSVLRALDRSRYDVVQIGITEDGAWVTGENVLDVLASDNPAERIAELTPVTILPDPSRRGLYAIQRDDEQVLHHLADLDVVFPVLHGTYGEDGTLQGLLEMADMAYVGAGVLGSAVGMDKSVFKDVMRANHIPVVDWMVFTRTEIENEIEEVMERIRSLGSYPLFVKPANLGSSVGITKCVSRGDLVEGLLEAARYDRRVLVEVGLNAREIEVSVLGNEEPQVSVPGEILPSQEFYSYAAKYLNGTSDLLIPAPLPRETTQLVQELAVKAYKAIDCGGMARVDFLLEKDASIHAQEDGLYLNEVNTIPGFTEISMYPKLWEASGLRYPALLDKLIELALERKMERDKTERRFHGSS